MSCVMMSPQNGVPFESIPEILSLWSKCGSNPANCNDWQGVDVEERALHGQFAEQEGDEAAPGQTLAEGEVDAQQGEEPLPGTDGWGPSVQLIRFEMGNGI